MNARDILSAGAVVPVIAIDDIHTAVDLAHALVEGGIPTLEITLRTEHGIKAIELIKKEVKGAIVGAGTVIKGAVNHEGDFVNKGRLESNGVVVDTHAHGGVLPGGANTGEPVK